MYRICLFLYIFNAAVSEETDEAKYIDLLPEEEKQEFLNRIARRILEEIQSKDSPDEPNAQVSDDQLNVHHSYVKDLIREESENLKNKKRKVEYDDHNRPPENEKLLPEQKNYENTEEIPHIDLTLREYTEPEKSKTTIHDDTSFSVIPVNVVYDQEDKRFQASTNNDDYATSHPLVGNYSDSLSEEKDIVNETDFKNNTQVSNKSETGVFPKTAVNKSDKTLDPSNEKLESSTDTFIYPLEENLEIITRKNDIELNNYIASLPLTTELHTKSDSNNQEYYIISTTTATTRPLLTYLNITRNITAKPNKNEEENKNGTIISDNNNYHVNKKSMNTDKDKENQAEKAATTSLRTRLESQFNKYSEKSESHEKSNEPKISRKAEDKEYIVYELPENKIFDRDADSKEHEQPYSVPIYNFAPNNAYYNPYNHLGPNNDFEMKVFERSYLYDDEDPDKEPFFRNDFEINLKNKQIDTRYKLDSNSQYRYQITQHPPWANQFNKYLKLKQSKDTEIKSDYSEKEYPYSPQPIKNNLKEPIPVIGELNNIDVDYYYGRTWEDLLKNNNKVNFIVDAVKFRDKPKLANLNMKLYHMDGHCFGSECEKKRKRLPAYNLDTDFESLINVLQDMIYKDRSYLVTYNWLEATIQIESAIEKLLNLIDNVERGNQIHPLDFQLLSYVVYLYNTSNESKFKLHVNDLQQSNIVQDIVKRFLRFLRRDIRKLPRNKRKKPGEKIRNPINMWYKYYLKSIVSDENVLNNHAEELDGLKTFLEDLQINLYDLHKAVKQIALITAYDDQHWYEDLKNIYMKSASKKQLLQLLLHLATSRMLTSIEESAKNGAEDAVNYIDNNKEVVRRIQDEFVFVMRILERIQMQNEY